MAEGGGGLPLFDSQQSQPSKGFPKAVVAYGVGDKVGGGFRLLPAAAHADAPGTASYLQRGKNRSHFQPVKTHNFSFIYIIFFVFTL